MADDKTAALVVALSAQLTKFEKDMKQAGDIADKTVSGIEDRFSKMNPGLATGIGTFLGALAGGAITAGIRELTTLYDRFKQIDETAKLAALSMNDVFGFQSASKGSSFAEVDKALVTLSGLLDRAKRGEDNNLSTIFSVNSVSLSSIKDAGEAMFKLADIISRLTPIQGLEVLQKLGLPANLLNDLSKGEDHLRQIQAKASAAAPDLQALADKAKEFDRLWKAAADNIKAYFTDNLDEVKRSIAGFIETTAKELRALEALGAGIRELFGITGKTGLAGQAAEKLEALANGLREPSPTRFTVRPNKVGTANPFPVDRGGGLEGEDSFERALAQANKRIAVLNAETGAIGLNSEARERAKLVAALEESAKRANSQAGLENTAVTDEQRAKINALADAMENAAAKSRIAYDQLSKINSASQIFGSALSSAFADAVVEGKNLNEVFSSLIKTLEKAAINSVFASIFNAPAGGGFSPFASLLGFGKVPGNAEGTDSWRGGPTWVGEKGPEIVNLPRGSQVIPNNVASRMGGSTFAPVTTIDARGMDPAAVGRFGQIMQRHEAALKQIARSMQSSQRFSMTGVS